MSVPADRIVLTSAMVTVTSTVAASILPESMGGKGELPKPRMLIGAALTFTGLSMAADFIPGVAAPLAGVVAVTAFSYYGLPILDEVFNNGHNNKLLREEQRRNER